MKTGWKLLAIAGVILLLAGSQVMAEPGWGRGQGWNRSQWQGMGRWAQGRGPIGPGGQGRGAGAWRPFGAGRGRPGGPWCPFGRGQDGMPGRRLNRMPNQVQPGAGQLGRGMAAPGRALRGGRLGGRGQGQGWFGSGRQNWSPPTRPGRQRPAVPSAPDAPAARGRRPGAQRTAPGRPAAPMDRMFDRADANKDGVLTREELQTLRQGNQGAPGASNQ